MITDYGFPSDIPSRSFRVSVEGQPVRVAEVPPMDAAERESLAAQYRKLPDYCHIYDPACLHLHYAHVGAEGDVAIEVEAAEEIREFHVLPARRGIAAEANGHRLRFAAGAAEPRYVIVRLNQLPPLMIVVDAPEAASDPGLAAIDAGKFLDDPTGATDQTAHLQRAFAAVAKAGGTLRIPAGVYSLSQLHLKDAKGVRLHLAAGCLLKVRPSLRGGNEHRHGLWIQGCEDVSVTGLGAIDHQAYEHYVLAGNDYQHGMVDYYTSNESCPWITQSPLFVTGSRRIRIEGITLRNGRNFNLNCRGCEDVAIRHVKILTPAACTPEYADGINTGSCRRVLVENCLVASNDDCFASGHYFATYDRGPSADHVVRGLVGWSLRGSGARLGFYADQDQGDFTFERCDVMGITYTSVLVHALRPSPEGRTSRYGRIRVADCSFDARRLLFLFCVEKAAVRELVLERVTFEVERPVRRALSDRNSGGGANALRTGRSTSIEFDPSVPVERVALEQVTCGGRRLLLVHADPVTVRYDQDAGDQREDAGHPRGNEQPEEQIEAEDNEE